MPNPEVLIVLVVIAALAFDYINGFHDTANAIATVVSTRVLKPRTAILMATALNFLGALAATTVAKTIASGLVEPKMATETAVLAAVLAGIIWNLVTWKYGIPSSSSHALIGGLAGAAIMHGGVSVVQWEGIERKSFFPSSVRPLLDLPLGLSL